MQAFFIGQFPPITATGVLLTLTGSKETIQLNIFKVCQGVREITEAATCLMGHPMGVVNRQPTVPSLFPLGAPDLPDPRALLEVEVVALMEVAEVANNQLVLHMQTRIQVSKMRLK